MLTNSKSGLLVCQSSLKGRLLIHALRLHLRGLVLHSRLLRRRQVCQRCLQSSLGLQLLCTLLRSQVLLANSKSGLLVGHGRLQRLLSIHALRLQLSGLILHVGLLRGRQVSQSHLQVCAKAQLLCGLLSAQVLRAHSEPGLLVCLLGREPRLLLGVELLLTTGKRLLKTFCLDIGLELSQVTGGFRLHDALTRTAKCTSAHGGGVTPLTSNVILALSFAQLDVRDRLLVGRHVLLHGSRSSDRLGAYALCGAHLSGLQALGAKT